MLLRHSPNNVCYSRIVRSASIPNNIHLTLVLLAYAFLVSICVQATRPLPAQALIALTPSEVRHLLARLLWAAPTSALLICQWSWWRRTPHYWAGYYHRRRRQKADSASFSHARAFPSPRELPALARNSPGSLAGSSPGTFPDPFPAQTSWENSRDFARALQPHLFGESLPEGAFEEKWFSLSERGHL